jgi:probable phosphoglycerate mutase
MKGEKVVYFVRHGQSLANVSPIFQPPDSPLSETGREQARSIAKRISRLSCEALIASSFRRAHETAEGIAQETGLALERCPLFVERIKPSSINGKPVADERASATWRQWEESLYNPSIRVEDGENFDDIVRRADEALAYLESRKEGALAVVTHGFFLRTLVARAMFGEMLCERVFKRFQGMAAMENTGLTVLRRDAAAGRGWRLWVYNDHAHLDERAR